MNLFKKIIILLVVLFTYACNSNASDIQNIDNQELKQLIQQGVPLVDVRTISEWKKTGIVEDSHLLTFYDEQGRYNLDKWLADLSEIANKDQPVILICHAGVRSKKIAKYLVKNADYKSVYNVKKGIKRWIKDKNPTVALQ